MFCVSFCSHFHWYTVGFGRSADNISTFVDKVFAGSVVSTVICLQCHTVRVYVLSVRMCVHLVCLYICVCYLSECDYYFSSCSVVPFILTVFDTYI